jgi:lipoyl(octanoyl) transferase
MSTAWAAPGENDTAATHPSSRPDGSARASTQPVQVRRLGLVEYRAAWDEQKRLAALRADDEIPDTLLLLEHPAVYTAGRRTEPADRPKDGHEVIDVDRGGKITWHGPGQLVGYPIIKLAEPLDVVKYVRRLEQALIEVVTGMGVRCGRVPGRSGVWVPEGPIPGPSGPLWQPERKIAAIGIRVARGVTSHGFALNCDSTLGGFDNIIPCGIPDAGVATLSRELGRDITTDSVIDTVQTAVLEALDGILPLRDCDLR